MGARLLMAVPNVSEGRDPEAVARIGVAFLRPPARLLDTHADPDHHRSVFSLAGPPGALSAALLQGARVAVEQVDLRRPRGAHPHVGALDVVPIVYLERDARGAACAEALLTGDLIADELGVPVFLYGALADGRSRADLRHGGPSGLAGRIARGELVPDFGPRRLHPSAGATLVAARPPLVAFNLELAAPADLAVARAVAARVREGGHDGLPGVRALGLVLPGRGGVAQVSMNIEDPLAVPLAAVLAAVTAHAEVAAAELVGLAPRAAFAGFPPTLPMPGFDPARHVIEEALGL